MRRFTLAILGVCISTAIIGMILLPMFVVSQPTDYNTQLNTVFYDVQKAELAGAKTEEINALLDQLNAVLALHDELQSLPPQETDKRTQLIAQISSTLSAVDAEANQLAAAASQRTQIDHALAYSSAAIAAVIGTVIYYCGTLLRRKYRVKRTFRMRIIPKAPA